jgi:hypothetical protein
MYWKKFFIILILKSNEGLRYERHILFIFVLATKVFPFVNHVFEKKNSQKMVIEMLFNKCYYFFF